MSIFFLQFSHSNDYTQRHTFPWSLFEEGKGKFAGLIFGPVNKTN